MDAERERGHARRREIESLMPAWFKKHGWKDGAWNYHAWADHPNYREWRDLHKHFTEEELDRDIAELNDAIYGDMEPNSAGGRRLAKIEALMGKSNSEYYRGPRADALQAEYRDLIDQRERAQHNRR